MTEPGTGVELASDGDRRAEVLQLRAAGISYPAIGARLGISTAQAVADGHRALADRAGQLETAELAGALEAERLDALQLLLAGVAESAVAGGDSRLALLAADRLALVSERRQASAPAGASAGDTEAAVLADLDRIPERLRESAAGRVAVLLARRLDAGLPAADMTAVAKELRATLGELAIAAEKAPPAESKVDELRDRRAARLAREETG